MISTSLAFPSGSSRDSVNGSTLTKTEWLYREAFYGAVANKATGTDYSSAALTLPTNMMASVKKFVDKVVLDLGTTFVGTSKIMQSNSINDTIATSTLTKAEYFLGAAVASVMADASNTNAMSTILSDTIVANMSTTARGMATAMCATILLAPAQPSIINGLASQTASETGKKYSVENVAGITYTWTVPSGWTVTGGSTTNEITVTVGSAGQNGNITVFGTNAYGVSILRTKAVVAV